MSVREQLQTNCVESRAVQLGSVQPTFIVSLEWTSLGIVSAEFVSGAVTNADRRDLPLAFLLFRQVFLQRKQRQPVSSLDTHNTDVSLKTEAKKITAGITSAAG